LGPDTEQKRKKAKSKSKTNTAKGEPARKIKEKNQSKIHQKAPWVIHPTPKAK